VIHDFWAYQLGIKADANPSTDNVAYTTTQQLGSVTVRCDELCGLWHGAMYNFGRVVAKSQFFAWAQATEHQNAANTNSCRRSPIPMSRCQRCHGGYYPDNVDQYSKVET